MHLHDHRGLACTALLILTAFSALAQVTVSTGPGQPPAPFTVGYSFPPLGLAFPETLQVNVSVSNQVPSAIYAAGNFSSLSTTLSNLITMTTTVTAATPCTGKGKITFTNAAGTVIGAPVPFTVTAGQIFSAPLPFTASVSSGFRGEIVASVQQTVDLSVGPACSLGLSIETFDTNTGVTHVFWQAPSAALPTGVFAAILTTPVPAAP